MLMTIIELQQWVKVELENLQSTVRNDKEMMVQVQELSLWFEQSGQEQLVSFSKDSFEKEQSFYQMLANAEIKIKYLRDFPYLTKLYGRREGQND